MTIFELISLALGGINLAFVLKLIYNDVEYLRNRIDEHIRDHLHEKNL